ncbi:MAG: tRNA (adenosine(37)-N6)-dimethylallyltransferase MiaA [Ignavibacteria bacterium]|nr:tRNA (adenosine(37)-N6)-dimethylallyltransferase MiaA [Ignavibacteria bacterium]
MNQKLITILGPTACGKTRLAVALAAKIGGEIISADSRQVYRGLNIGSGKDLGEYIANNHAIPYHLIDIVDLPTEYHIFSFVTDFRNAFESIISRDKIPILTGGSGMYLSAILEGYDLIPVDFESERAAELKELSVPELQLLLREKAESLHNSTDLLLKDRLVKAILINEHKTAHKNDGRPVYDSVTIGIAPPREIVRERITKRLKERLETGMIEEVAGLIRNGIQYDKLEFLGLEYRYIGRYISGQISYDEMFERLNIAIHQFAKRQMTWFRRMEKNGVKIHWIESPDSEIAESIVREAFC